MLSPSWSSEVLMMHLELCGRCASQGRRRKARDVLAQPRPLQHPAHALSIDALHTCLARRILCSWSVADARQTAERRLHEPSPGASATFGPHKERLVPEGGRICWVALGVRRCICPPVVIRR